MTWHTVVWPSPVMPVIHTHNLTKNYGTRRGIDQINLDVAEGEVFGFLGPNGAGKSTTIRLLMGFLRASTGDAKIFGRDCWSDSPVIREDVGYVAGDVRLYPWLTARRGLQIVGEIRQRDLRQRGDALIEQFCVEPDLPVRKMSRGNRQKLALVLALAHHPRLVVLDEPTSGLDPIIQDRLADWLRDLAGQGHTVFFSSHTLSEVESLCDRVAIVRDGQIVADERLAALKQRAPRIVNIAFESSAAAEQIDVSDFGQDVTRSGREISFRLTGSAVELTKWAAEQPLADIAIGEPSLETVFHTYYDRSKPHS